MAIRRMRGFTLVELIVYFGLSVIVLGLLFSMFTVAKRTQQHTYSQYLVGGPIASTIRLIRRDLQATALTSIQVHQDANERPGLSFVSAYNNEGTFVIGDYGTPRWQKHVAYHLNEKNALVRRTQEIADKDYLPRPSTLPPSAMTGGRAVLHGLLAPNRSVENVQPATSYGGFEVGFVRRGTTGESIHPTNPAKSTDYPSHTRLLEVTLRTSGERDSSFAEIRFRVCPRY